ncbi:MAG: class I SAM-dependent methyltransferase [Chloroflexi bacterium]|nr:class I SAM-dependent methyltransferase [Chloroflexota bacterium]
MDNILSQLIKLQQKPSHFEPVEPLFWNDPHISAQMLKVHLDPNVDAASRKPETIDRSVRWVIETLALKSNNAVLDLGCGPGLYASSFARAGLQVIEKLYEKERKKIVPVYPVNKKIGKIELPEEIIADLKFFLLAGNKAAAVKRVVELTGATLRMSIDFVDGLQ